MRPQYLLAVATEGALELFEGKRVEHVAGFNPAAPGGGDAEAHDREVVGGMGIGIDK